MAFGLAAYVSRIGFPPTRKAGFQVLVRLSWAGFDPQSSYKRFQLTSCGVSSSSKLLGTIRLTFCTLQSKVQYVSLAPAAAPAATARLRSATPDPRPDPRPTRHALARSTVADTRWADWSGFRRPGDPWTPVWPPPSTRPLGGPH